MKREKKFRVPYALAVYGREEIAAVNRVLADPTKISPGALVKEFEKEIADVFGKAYGVMVNSGSSANLLALEVLDLPRGSEVITPILTFSTTLAPIIQKGLVPIFVDVKEDTYNIDETKVEAVITPKTKALMIPSLIGNLPNFIKLRQIAKKHDLWFIEDSCDTLGARFGGKPTGYYSDISTTSFYASHIITAGGGGGMICFNDLRLAQKAMIKSAWGRQSTLFGNHEQSEEITKRFSGAIGDLPYDAKFIFSEIGYNFQPTEMSAAFGLAQLKKLDKFSALRQKNFSDLSDFFKKYEKVFSLPKADSKTATNWLAFPLTIKKGSVFSRHQITKYLEEHAIQTRPVFTGNVLRQPAFQSIQRNSNADYPVADYIMANSFLIGCHQGLTQKQLSHLKKTFREFLNNHGI